MGGQFKVARLFGDEQESFAGAGDQGQGFLGEGVAVGVQGGRPTRDFQKVRFKGDPWLSLLKLVLARPVVMS